MGKKAPKAPDPMQTAQQQQQFNTQTAQQNQQFQTEAWKNNFAATKNATNPFAQSQQIIDPATGLPTGSSVGFSGGWGQGVDSAGDAFAANAGNGLMPNFDTSTVNGIMQTGMGNYFNLTAPGIEQGQRRIDQEVANRGIPINDKIATDMQGNFDQKNNLAAGAFFADLYGRAPGLQSQLDQNEMYRNFAPTQQALTLGTQSMGLLPSTGQPQMGAAQAGNVDYTNLVNNNYNQQMAQYNANQAALGGLFGGIGKWAMSPVSPGGFGATNLGNMFR
jgi:hypothetical protein